MPDSKLENVDRWVSVGEGETVKHIPIVDGKIGHIEDGKGVPRGDPPKHVMEKIHAGTRDPEKKAAWEGKLGTQVSEPSRRDLAPASEEKLRAISEELKIPLDGIVFERALATYYDAKDPNAWTHRMQKLIEFKQTTPDLDMKRYKALVRRLDEDGVLYPKKGGLEKMREIQDSRKPPHQMTEQQFSAHVKNAIGALQTVDRSELKPGMKVVSSQSGKDIAPGGVYEVEKVSPSGHTVTMRFKSLSGDVDHSFTLSQTADKKEPWKFQVATPELLALAGRHESHVKKAIERGDPVPPEVMRGHLELALEHGLPTADPATVQEYAKHVANMTPEEFRDVLTDAYLDTGHPFRQKIRAMGNTEEAKELVAEAAARGDAERDAFRGVYGDVGGWASRHSFNTLDLAKVHAHAVGMLRKERPSSEVSRDVESLQQDASKLRQHATYTDAEYEDGGDLDPEKYAAQMRRLGLSDPAKLTLQSFLNQHVTGDGVASHMVHPFKSSRTAELESDLRAAEKAFPGATTSPGGQVVKEKRAAYRESLDRDYERAKGQHQVFVERANRHHPALEKMYEYARQWGKQGDVSTHRAASSAYDVWDQEHYWRMQIAAGRIGTGEDPETVAREEGSKLKDWIRGFNSKQEERSKAWMKAFKKTPLYHTSPTAGPGAAVGESEADDAMRHVLTMYRKATEENGVPSDSDRATAKRLDVEAREKNRLKQEDALRKPAPVSDAPVEAAPGSIPEGIRKKIEELAQKEHGPFSEESVSELSPFNLDTHLRIARQQKRDAGKARSPDAIVATALREHRWTVRPEEREAMHRHAAYHVGKQQVLAKDRLHDLESAKKATAPTSGKALQDRQNENARQLVPPHTFNHDAGHGVGDTITHPNNAEWWSDGRNIRLVKHAPKGRGPADSQFSDQRIGEYIRKAAETSKPSKVMGVRADSESGPVVHVETEAGTQARFPAHQFMSVMQHGDRVTSQGMDGPAVIWKGEQIVGAVSPMKSKPHQLVRKGAQPEKRVTDRERAADALEKVGEVGTGGALRDLVGVSDEKVKAETKRGMWVHENAERNPEYLRIQERVTRQGKKKYELPDVGVGADTLAGARVRAATLEALADTRVPVKDIPRADLEAWNDAREDMKRGSSVEHPDKYLERRGRPVSDRVKALAR